jgi:hypothetical protein
MNDEEGTGNGERERQEERQVGGKVVVEYYIML